MILINNSDVNTHTNMQGSHLYVKIELGPINIIDF
jgi:hypothetical protein